MTDSRRTKPEREYVVLEQWDAYVEVVVFAPSKKVALERAKEALAAAEPDERHLYLPVVGNPTGRFEVRRV